MSSEKSKLHFFISLLYCPRDIARDLSSTFSPPYPFASVIINIYHNHEEERIYWFFILRFFSTVCLLLLLIISITFSFSGSFFFFSSISQVIFLPIHGFLF